MFGGRTIVRRGVVVAGMVVAGVGVAACVARRPLEEHLAEGTLPGRAGSWLNSYFNRPCYRSIAAALDLGPEDEILDVACGWGEFLAAYASEARCVAGIDGSEQKVGLARRRLADRIAEGSTEVVQGDAAALPWEEGTFSAVTCMDAFPFFTDPELVMGEVLRVLRPGGRMLTQVGMRWPDGPPKHLPHPISPYAADEAALRRLVEDAGFGEISMSYGMVGGEGRVGNLVSRLTTASDELRFVAAIKPR